MTNETRQKFFSLAHAAVSSMASDESLRDLFDAVFDTPIDEWPKGSRWVSNTTGMTWATCMIASDASGNGILIATEPDDQPIIVSTQTEEQP